MRTIRLLGLFAALGSLAACPQQPIPGEDSETSTVFQEVAETLYGELPTLTPRQALDVLDHAVEEVSPGSHANLNAAAVALDKDEDDKAVDHLEKFKDKVDKERGKKVAEDDADFMNFVADSIIEGINDGDGG